MIPNKVRILFRFYFRMLGKSHYILMMIMKNKITGKMLEIILFKISIPKRTKNF